MKESYCHYWKMQKTWSPSRLQFRAISGRSTKEPNQQSTFNDIYERRSQRTTLWFFQTTNSNCRWNRVITIILLLFSKNAFMHILSFRLPYETFDILTDEDVRQGLKTYSDWPTYPQVDVKCELVGGLDIIKELIANKELEATLKG